jgi:tRNA_anti-like
MTVVGTGRLVMALSMMFGFVCAAHTQPKTEQKTIVMSADELAKAFATNAKKAQKEYGNATITVKGVVDKVEGNNITLMTDSKLKVIIKVDKATDQTLQKTKVEGTGTILEVKFGRVLMKVGEVKLEAESKDITTEDLIKAYKANPKTFAKEYQGLVVKIKGEALRVDSDLVWLTKPGDVNVFLKPDKAPAKTLLNAKVEAKGRILVNQSTIFITVPEITAVKDAPKKDK